MDSEQLLTIVLGACFAGPCEAKIRLLQPKTSSISPVIQECFTLDARVAQIPALQSVEAVPHSTL